MSIYFEYYMNTTDSHCNLSPKMYYTVFYCALTKCIKFILGKYHPIVSVSINIV